jgi:hypothetical protein
MLRHHNQIFVAVLLVLFLCAASIQSFAQPPDGGDVTISDVGGGTPVAGGWGNNGGDITTPGDVGNSPGPDPNLTSTEPDRGALPGIAGGNGSSAASRGGHGGMLDLTVIGNANFTTDYPWVLGTSGGNGGVGGEGGTGQTGGHGYLDPFGMVTPDDPDFYNGARGGRGGNGAVGTNGGNGGNLTFTHSAGTVLFANNITFGGTGGIGGGGGVGGTGGTGGNARHASNGTGATGGDGGDGGNGGIGGNGGNATFALSDGTITFSNATFGGTGGAGGNGGLAGIGGVGGTSQSGSVQAGSGQGFEGIICRHFFVLAVF